jgi:serine/threonine protein kinase/tetratricopeptide (TPR) repeat protein
MSASTDKPKQTCAKCGTLLQLVGQFSDLCAACLLELGWEEEEVRTANAERFDHYQVATHTDGTPVELGRGAMGITYRASDTILGNEVALKVIDARIAALPEARERFLREARAAARLRHPNIASVFYYGTRKSDGQCFYAMELVEGETLETRLRHSGPLPPSLALEVITQAARALVALETHGLVHRDLKPANLMLVERPELTVKVIDFGLAKAVATSGSESEITHGGFVGTPSFASPEQFTNTSVVDVRSDLYSLGITLWEMLTGQTPFRGTPREVMHQHQHASLPLDLLEAVPQPAVVLLDALLEKDPGRRFQTPADLLNAIPTITDAIDARRKITRQSLQKTSSTASRTVTVRPPRTIPGPDKISVARLPVTGSDVFGREEDIAFLDDAWANQGVNVVTIVAWAGVGKSALVNHWLGQMAIEHYRSAELVFGWSFYRQGTSRGSSSADEFLDAALTWFGDPDPRIGTAWEKGERLAKLMSHRRTLLVLDGLEPLQNPPGPQEGRVRGPALQALLRELAAFNTGLCVVTTRIPVADIADHEQTSVLRRDLEQLSSDAGAKLLRALGVKGHEAELRSASDEFSGHCLALTLMGSYLADAYDGDIRYREEVSKHLAHDVRQGVHAQKVMESYQTWFGEGSELSILRILGLFDRPADEKAICALLKSPPIPGLTESLTDLSPSEWRTTLARLRRARLLAAEDSHCPRQLDIHPLIREYFGEQLRNQRAEAWKESNRRLYNHYRRLAPHLPDNFRAMEPLFLAVICACNAGLFRAALHEVYIPRIQRENTFFAANVLNARGALLSVLAHFFENGSCGSPFETAAEGESLTVEDQLFVLMQVAQYIPATRGLGAPEARICYERAVSLCHSLHHPRLLCLAVKGLWRFSIMTDKPSVALPIAERVYSLAQEQDDPTLMIGANNALAGTLLYLSEFESARQYALRAVQLWRSGSVQSHPEDFDTPVVGCLCYQAMSEWHLGEIAACRANINEAISLAKELKDTNALALALNWAASLGQRERNPARVDRLAADLMELSARHNFVYFLAVGAIYSGWARSASGDSAEGIARIEQGIRDFRATGAVRGLSYYLSLKAETLHLADRTPEAIEAINEAERLAESFEDRVSCANLHRLRGVFLATVGADETQIEASFCAALRIAREQKSISLVKTAEATYAEYCRQKANSSGRRGFRVPLW